MAQRNSFHSISLSTNNILWPPLSNLKENIFLVLFVFDCAEELVQVRTDLDWNGWTKLLSSGLEIS